MQNALYCPALLYGFASRPAITPAKGAFTTVFFSISLAVITSYSIHYTKLYEIDVTKKANEFNLKLNELNFAAKADTISQSAYEATQELFTQGKVSVININESYKAMYSAKNQYLSALRNFV